VLVADDNRTNQRLVELFLEEHHHLVTTVGNGRDAVAKAAEHAFDLILMDVQMPDMDGLEATAAIRQREREAGVHTPIVAMTAHAMAGDREKCLAAGMDAYLSKPLRPDDLASTIAALCATGTGAAPRPDTGATADGAIAEADLLADFGGNGKVLAEVIGVFLGDASKYLDTIRRTRESRDHGSMAAAVHALKGSVGLFSRSACDAVQALEQSVKAGDTSAIEQRFAVVESALGQLCPQLDAVSRRLRSER
jgi:CheY-like chemotaxis protein